MGGGGLISQTADREAFVALITQCILAELGYKGIMEMEIARKVPSHLYMFHIIVAPRSTPRVRNLGEPGLESHTVGPTRMLYSSSVPCVQDPSYYYTVLRQL